MNCVELAKQAQMAAAPYAAILSAELVRKLEMAHIAEWLDKQDLSVRDRAATTACSAIDCLRMNDVQDA